MNRTSAHTMILRAALAAFLLLGMQTGHTERLYKWVDEHGVVRYGDRVPPEYAKKDVKVMNEQGIVVDEIDAPMTAEERAAEERKRQRLEAIRREVAAKKRYDMNLLETYANVGEIEIERDRRVSAVDAQITQANRQIRLLQSKMARLEMEAQNWENRAQAQEKVRPLPDNLITEMGDTRDALDEYEAQLRGFYVAQADLRLKFNGDMVRFRELKRAGN